MTVRFTVTLNAAAIDLGGGVWLPIVRDGDHTIWHGPRAYSDRAWAEKIAKGKRTRIEQRAAAIRREIIEDSDAPEWAGV